MQYMLLIYSNEADDPKPETPEFGPFMGGYQAFTQKMQAEKKFISGEALHSASTATTVTVRNGKTEVMDGPFAETKESLGGYYLLDCKDLDEAIACAALIPTASYGRIEVRPIVVWE